MCNLSQAVKEEGRLEGRQEGRQEERLLLLKNLMESMKMPIEQALMALRIPEGDWQEYQNLLAER